MIECGIGEVWFAAWVGGAAGLALGMFLSAIFSINKS